MKEINQILSDLDAIQKSNQYIQEITIQEYKRQKCTAI